MKKVLANVVAGLIVILISPLLGVATTIGAIAIGLLVVLQMVEINDKGKDGTFRLKGFGK